LHSSYFFPFSLSGRHRALRDRHAFLVAFDRALSWKTAPYIPLREIADSIGSELEQFGILLTLRFCSVRRISITLLSATDLLLLAAG